MNNKDIEKAIQDLKLTAPRVTLDRIEGVIVDVDFYVFPRSSLTVCCLTLENGFTVTGESACASPENFNEKLGREISYTKAKDKIWMLEGYLLTQQLYEKKLEVEGEPVVGKVDD